MAKRPKTPAESGFRGKYGTQGVERYYRGEGQTYRNPHEAAIASILEASFEKWALRPGLILDLACGSGEVTLALNNMGFLNVVGMDPFTEEAYCSRTGKRAERLAFEDIEAGQLTGRFYDLIICSYALHLVAPSRLPRLMYQLSFLTPQLIIITPHKRPHVSPSWNWSLQDEIYHLRVRSRLYHSCQVESHEGVARSD